jgi:hypothetical protein
MLVFHGVLEYDIEGNVINEDKQAGRDLGKLIKDANTEAQETFFVRGPQDMDIKPFPETQKRAAYYENKYNSLLKETGLNPNSSVYEYAMSMGKNVILEEAEKANVVLPDSAIEGLAARIADVNLTPTELSKSNLENEKVSGMKFVIGNTVLDNLLEYKHQCEYQNKVLVTLHRRENHYWMDEWFKELEKLANENPELEFILPIHPNPNVQKHRHLLSKVQVVEPLSHRELLKILVKCRLVISDSGGLQEEGSFFNKKVIVCRTTTERPEAIETGHLYLCPDPKTLPEIFGSLKNNYYIDNICPYGDGYSSKRLIQILRNERF